MMKSGNAYAPVMNTAITAPMHKSDMPMLCRMPRISLAPQNWLMKIAPPDDTPKQNSMYKNAYRLACTTAA